MNIVKTESIEVNTTSCAANSPSASICSAIVKDDTATGADNIIITLASSIFLNPKYIAIGININGTIINLPTIPITSCLKFLLIFSILNDPLLKTYKSL